MGIPDGNIFVHIAMFGWIPIVMMLFNKLDARLAVASAFVGGWMFLPVASYHISGLPSYNKITATCVVILAGAYIYDKERFSQFHFSAADIPMILWCTSPFFSSFVNDLGVHDGLSQAMYQSISWGIPYFIARIYFKDASSIKILALSIFIGCVVYIPFCWFEMIMSPQLHRLTYGYHQSDFIQTLREGGGFRPMVYMDHGLMTSMWMALGVFLGIWLFFYRRTARNDYLLAFTISNRHARYHHFDDEVVWCNNPSDDRPDYSLSFNENENSYSRYCHADSTPDLYFYKNNRSLEWKKPLQFY